ncbi:PITH domain-containing protein [Russula emetica]|nr:PITH domain-containing protein [Russula emetica]
MSTSRSEGSSLLEYLDLSQLNCLNEVDDHNAKGIFSGKTRNTTSSSYLLSDADEQLLLNIYFNQAVRIKSIVLHTATNSHEGPKLIKLLINKSALGFEDVEDAEEPEAALVQELTEDTVKEGRQIDLKFVRFQSVNSLHIFVSSNQGGEEVTRIDAIDILGFPTG